jgi:hypothetical protein
LTSVTASSDSRATFPSPHCGTRTKFRPCTYPRSASAGRNASSSCSGGGAARRNPIRRARSPAVPGPQAAKPPRRRGA